MPSEVEASLSAARQPLVTVKYDCLGCEVCYPALAINALNQAGHAIEPDACANEPVEERAGWPPLPGTYAVLRYQAPVAVCTLTDEELAERIAREAGESIAIVGSLHTENLGIERLVANVVANPHIRFRPSSLSIAIDRIQSTEQRVHAAVVELLSGRSPLLRSLCYLGVQSVVCSLRYPDTPILRYSVTLTSLASSA